jgi:hypothetical protein
VRQDNSRLELSNDFGDAERQSGHIERGFLVNQTDGPGLVHADPNDSQCSRKLAPASARIRFPRSKATFGSVDHVTRCTVRHVQNGAVLDMNKSTTGADRFIIRVGSDDQGGWKTWRAIPASAERVQ